MRSVFSCVPSMKYILSSTVPLSVSIKGFNVPGTVLSLRTSTLTTGTLVLHHKVSYGVYCSLLTCTCNTNRPRPAGEKWTGEKNLAHTRWS